MAVTRSFVKQFIFEKLSDRFHRPASDFSEDQDLRKKWSFDSKSLRTWGDKLRTAAWYTGWFAPSEIIDCKKVGDVIQLMYDTQDRPKPVVAAAKWAKLQKA